MKIASMLILVVFSLSMVSGAFATEKAIKDNNIEEKQLTVKINEKLKIKLESNPSTGYIWIPEYNSEFLKLIKSKYYSPKDDNCIVGKPGIQKFVFKAIKTGEAKITLNYGRPWENSIPAKVIVYHVKIIE